MGIEKCQGKITARKKKPQLLKEKFCLSGLSPFYYLFFHQEEREKTVCFLFLYLAWVSILRPQPPVLQQSVKLFRT